MKGKDQIIEWIDGSLCVCVWIDDDDYYYAAFNALCVGHKNDESQSVCVCACALIVVCVCVCVCVSVCGLTVH